jgi:hypothetical protein
LKRANTCTLNLHALQLAASAMLHRVGYHNDRLCHGQVDTYGPLMQQPANNACLAGMLKTPLAVLLHRRLPW